MTFNPNSPQGNDSPANQVGKVQTNFSTYATGFSKNHTALNDPSQGSHSTIIFEKQAVDPVITDNYCVLYSKDSTSKLGTQPQLFLRIPVFLPTKLDNNNPSNPAMQLTYNQVNIAGPIYQSFLPGKNLLYFGMTSIANPLTSTNVTVSPSPTKILMALAYATSTSLGAARLVSTKIISSTQFTIFTTAFTSPSVTFTWMAIATA